MEVRNFINGNFVDSFSKQNIRVVNPADQTDVGFIDEALDDEIEFAFDAASQAHQKRVLQDMEQITRAFDNYTNFTNSVTGAITILLASIEAFFSSFGN